MKIKVPRMQSVDNMMEHFACFLSCDDFRVKIRPDTKVDPSYSATGNGKIINNSISVGHLFTVFNFG